MDYECSKTKFSAKSVKSRFRSCSDNGITTDLITKLVSSDN